MFLKYFITFALICSSFSQEIDDTTTTPDPTTPTTPTTPTPTPPTPTPPTTSTTSEPITEKPVLYKFYNVTENNSTCIMIDGNFTFRVQYNIAPNKTNTTELEIPRPSNEVNVTGSCNDGGKQYIKISWGKTFMSSVKIVFSSSKDDKSKEEKWLVENVTSILFMDDETFPNGTDAGKTLRSEIPLKLVPSEVPFNKSYMCYSSLNLDKVNTTMEKVDYTHDVDVRIQSLHLMAFNKIPNTTNFVEDIHCDADKIADIVPIAVGCALAALILIVLVAYVVGRRRRSASYQSV